MARNSASTTANAPTKEEASSAGALPELLVNEVESFFIRKGASAHLHDTQKSKDFYSFLFRNLLKVNRVQRGTVSCFFSVLPAFINIYGGLHGGVIGGISERVAIACARTVVAEDKELFFGELSMSYLSAAPLNEMCVVDGSIVRSGRNLTVVAMEFRTKKTGKLVYTARATFYHMPTPRL